LSVVCSSEGPENVPKQPTHFETQKLKNMGTDTAPPLNPSPGHAPHPYSRRPGCFHS